MKKLLFIVFLVFISSFLHAQNNGGRGNWWYFGDSLSMNFNGLVPNQSNVSSLRTANSAISMSNKQGDLLFYGNHRFIYDSTHQVMQNGVLFNYTNFPPTTDFLDGNMGALVLPMPCNSNLYYHFYISPNNNQTTLPFTNSLLYSVIDMSLNNGLGGVVATQKNVFVDDSLYHFITATKHANNRDYWIMTRKIQSNEWKAWLLTPTGLSLTPVNSFVGLLPVHTQWPGYIGQIKFSNNGHKMAMANMLIGGNQCSQFYTHPNPAVCLNLNRFELFDFDRVSGVLSNSLVLDFDSSFYDFNCFNCQNMGKSMYLLSVEFSPNDSILYAVTGHVVVQYDLSSNNPAIIPSAWNIASRSPVSGIFYLHAQMGSDKKIYIIGGANLDVIHNPNVFGSGCNFQDSALLFPRSPFLSLPNIVSDALINRSISLISPAGACPNTTLQLSLIDTTFIDSTVWHFADSANTVISATTLPISHSLPTSGHYPVMIEIFSGCELDTVFDTIYVHPLPNAHLGPDTILCEGDTLDLFFQDSTFSYLWSTGDTSPGIRILAADTYSLTVTSLYCGVDVDTIVIDSLIPALVHFPNDTLLCLGDTLLLDATVALGSYIWNVGDTTPTFVVQNEGLYSVTATNLCGTDSNSISVSYARPPLAQLPNDTVLCRSETLLLDVSDTLASYSWHNGDTLPTLVADSAGVYWVNINNLCGSLSDTFLLQLADTPQLNFPVDTVMCEGDTLHWGQSQALSSYAWNTGSTDSMIAIHLQGNYILTLSNACGSTMDSIQVYYDNAPITNLGPDTMYCITSLVMLDATWSRASYLWQNGSTDSTHLADSTGRYWVEVTNLCGFDDDTVRIEYQTPISFSLGADTALCDGDSISLHANGSHAEFVWNTGSSDSVIFGFPGNTYWVRAENLCGVFGDTIKLHKIFKPLYTISQGDTLCEGDNYTIRIEPQNSFEARWPDGSLGNSQTVNQSGVYHIELSNICGIIDEYIPVIFSPFPKPDLGSDTLLCPGERVMLQTAYIPRHNYLWSTGDTTHSIEIEEAGIYRISVSNPHGCQGTDEIEVVDCGIRVYIPNAFTPNGDGINDEFKVYIEGVNKFWLAIYDRWGNEVFFSENPKQGWNGTHFNQAANAGTYTYKIYYRSGEYKSETRIGSVELLR
jgi:gliding motility-associated-like protein